MPGRGGAWSRGCVPGLGVCVPGPGGSAWSGGGLPQCLVGYHHPPPREQNDKQVQKYYLDQNFVAAGNKNAFQ